jgi:hypothetical protein
MDWVKTVCHKRPINIAFVSRVGRVSMEAAYDFTNQFMT